MVLPGGVGLKVWFLQESKNKGVSESDQRLPVMLLQLHLHRCVLVVEKADSRMMLALPIALNI